MIYFIVTACLYNNCNIRKEQYIRAINKLKESLHNYENYCKIIVVENNGARITFLNDLNVEVMYTNNNSLPQKNKGYKELRDVIDCIEQYEIQDADFVVKMTGRYILQDESEFIKVIKENIKNMEYDCIIRYGSYMKPSNNQMKDCITGLIGMRCKYVKDIEFPSKNVCVEWNWAKVTYKIDNTKIYKAKSLGISICPNSNKYFLV
jgi:hypothetical protein